MGTFNFLIFFLLLLLSFTLLFFLLFLLTISFIFLLLLLALDLLSSLLLMTRLFLGLSRLFLSGLRRINYIRSVIGLLILPALALDLRILLPLSLFLLFGLTIYIWILLLDDFLGLFDVVGMLLHGLLDFSGSVRVLLSEAFAGLRIFNELSGLLGSLGILFDDLLTVLLVIDQALCLGLSLRQDILMSLLVILQVVLILLVVVVIGSHWMMIVVVIVPVVAVVVTVIIVGLFVVMMVIIGILVPVSIV